MTAAPQQCLLPLRTGRKLPVCLTNVLERQLISGSDIQESAQSLSPPRASWQHLPSHRASCRTGTRRNQGTWEPEVPYLRHCQDKVHRWVLRIDPLQLHPHFKAILVLGSYLVLETKIKLQCKKRHR